MSTAGGEPGSWEAGGAVVVSGLRKAAELNGRAGKIVRWMADKGRYEVNLDGLFKAIRPANLELVSGEGEHGEVDVIEVCPATPTTNAAGGDLDEGCDNERGVDAGSPSSVDNDGLKRPAAAAAAGSLDPPSFVARAMFDFEGSGDSDDLELREGDWVDDVHEILNGWLAGTNRRTRRHGMFPGSHVELGGGAKHASNQAGQADHLAAPHSKVEHAVPTAAEAEEEYAVPTAEEAVSATPAVAVAAGTDPAYEAVPKSGLVPSANRVVDDTFCTPSMTAPAGWSGPGAGDGGGFSVLPPDDPGQGSDGATGTGLNFAAMADDTLATQEHAAESELEQIELLADAIAELEEDNAILFS